MSDGRLATMLQQLEPAFLTATTNRLSSATFSTSPDFKPDRKARIKQDLEEQIAALSASADDKEELLRHDIDEVEVKLEGVLASKRRVKQEAKYVSETLLHKKELLLGSIQKLQKQYDELESVQQNIETGLDSDQAEKLNAFKTALRPLEEAAHAILTEKERLTRNNEQFNERLLPLQESLFMTKEDIRAHIVASEAALLNRRTFEEQLTVFKEKHEEELADFLEELETREMLKSIRMRKAEQIEKVKKVDRKIVENEKSLTELQLLLNKVTRETSGPPAKAENKQEIERLETYLQRKSIDLQIPELPSIISSTNADIGFTITEVVRRAQVDQLDKKELQLLETWRDELMTMEHELAALQSRIVIDEKALMAQISQGHAPDSYLEKTCKEEKNKGAALADAIAKTKARNKLREEAIDRWKTKMRIALGDSAPPRSIPASDSDIMKAYSAAVEQKTSDPEQQAAVTNILQMYCEQLQSATEKAGERDEKNRKRRRDIEELSAKVQSAEFQKSSLAVERSALQKELTKLITTEKGVSKRFEQMKMKAESSQKRAHEDLLSSELSSRSGEMSQIFKTMGSKAVQRLADKAKQDVSRTVSSRQKDRRARLEEKYKEYQGWDKVAHWHSEAIEDQLKPQYQTIAVAINSLKGDAERLRDQLRAIQEAEDELSAKTEAIVELKKKELRMSMNHAAKAQQAHMKTKKLEAVKVQLEVKTQKLDETDKEAEEQETTAHSKLSEIMLEEAQLKTKLGQLQTQMVEVGGDRQQVKALEKKLRVIEREKREDAARTESQALIRRPMTILGEGGSMIRPITRAKSLPELTFESICEKEGQEPEMNIQQDEEGGDSLLQLEAETQEKQFEVEVAQSPEEPQPPLPAFSIRFNECSKSEAEFFTGIHPLLEGMILFKKLGVKGSAKVVEFDPLEGTSPESCGYGLRELKLGKALKKLEIRQPGKPGVDSAIMISQLLDPIIPKHTLAILTAQKKRNSISGILVDEDVEGKYREMKEQDLVDYSSPVFEQMSQGATLYPLVIALDKGGRIDLIARSYSEFRTLLNGIRALLKMSKELHRLKYKVE